MNSDRCYHVPTSPGQTVCTCVDYLMWLRVVIEVQARYIADLERRMQTVPPRVLRIGVGDAPDLEALPFPVPDLRGSRP